MVLVQMSVITGSKTDHIFLASGSLNFYTVKNQLLRCDSSLMRTFWVFERRELTHRKSVAALIWLNKIAFRINTSVIRQIITYICIYAYINTNMFSHFCWLCPEVKNLTKSAGKGVNSHREFKFSWRVTKRLSLPAVGCSLSLPSCRRGDPVAGGRLPQQVMDAQVV